MRGYIINHWRGQHRLLFSIAVSFVLIGLVYHQLEPRLLAFFSTRPDSLIAVALSYLVLTRLIIFPWQIIGLLRSADRQFRIDGRTMVLYLVQGLVLISIILTISHSLTRLQQLSAYHERSVFNDEKQSPSFTVQIDRAAHSLLVQGDLDFGTTRAVEQKLNQFPEITTIVLTSRGGQIYEGRGLGLLFKARGLNTRVDLECSSACTTAFIGGAIRTLGQHAKLGFHQYGMDSKRNRQITAFQNLKDEQRKDRKLFISQGVDPQFLDNLFSTPHSKITFPTAQQLLNAGVLSHLPATDLN